MGYIASLTSLFRSSKPFLVLLYVPFSPHSEEECGKAQALTEGEKGGEKTKKF
jgi:hypothetical protein